MTICAWCGDYHSPERLCQRAQVGTSRRSFMFLFGAGVAGLALGGELIGAEDYVSDSYVRGILRRAPLSFNVQWDNHIVLSPNGGDLGSMLSFRSHTPLPVGANVTIGFDGQVVDALEDISHIVGKVFASHRITPNEAEEDQRSGNRKVADLEEHRTLPSSTEQSEPSRSGVQKEEPITPVAGAGARAGETSTD